MKLITSLAASAALLAASANAAPQGAWHVRVHTHTELKGESEACSASGGAVQCRGDLTCVQVSDWYGACMMLKPTLMKQCGGHSLTGPWKYPCVPNAKGVNSTCVFLSPYFSQCQDLATREMYRYKGKSHKQAKALKAHDASQPIQLYGQCKWADAAVKCADGLQCITENDHYGQCRKREAALYEQCGGKSWKEPWSATCAGASVCVKRDEWYSQCLPTGTPATASPAPGPSFVTPIGGKPAAGKWDQCGGANFQGPTACATGSVCVKHNNWYSQCKPDKLPIGELCAMTKQDSTWSHPFCEGAAKCTVSNSDGSESRCK